MRKQITQRQLRNEIGKIMRALDRGDEFVLTRNGVPIGELVPIRRRYARTDDVLAIFRGSPPIDFKRFRRDVDALVDQDPTARG